MAKSSNTQKPVKTVTAREARLKAALKANLARRKAQARARVVKDEKTTGDDAGSGT
ncbi:hypothetical protein [Oceaniglobus ichthyenteri]|uniref:hypothetical protein n=1 Tax=Oceaniglobus ichthyenteri TaxID=2136177 RepID=UPI0013DDD100|nr:hypothetical protein [Oceaniglobus ichthyenteri]